MLARYTLLFLITASSLYAMDIAQESHTEHEQQVTVINNTDKTICVRSSVSFEWTTKPNQYTEHNTQPILSLTEQLYRFISSWMAPAAPTFRCSAVSGASKPEGILKPTESITFKLSLCHKIADDQFNKRIDAYIAIKEPNGKLWDDSYLTRCSLDQQTPVTFSVTKGTDHTINIQKTS